MLHPLTLFLHVRVVDDISLLLGLLTIKRNFFYVFIKQNVTGWSLLILIDWWKPNWWRLISVPQIINKMILVL